MALNWAKRLCPAILQAFFPGMEGGHAIAEALFGEYNPGGKLTCTFPKTTGQLEMNFPTKPSANAEPAGPGRVNVAGLLWPFGFGLSYTAFGYSGLEIEPAQQTSNGTITVSFTLANTGSRAGDEIPQLYVNQEVSSVTTWEKRLVGFDRVHLAPGESRKITMTITPECLAIWNREMKRVVEPGKFRVMVGASSEDIRLKGEFEIASNASTGVRVERGVAYLAEGRKERADLYFPAEMAPEAKLPAVVVIHGGGWAGGKRDAAREINIGTTLARNGYVAMSIDYLLSERKYAVWPTNLWDCKTAVRWLRKNAARLGVDPDRIGVLGGSPAVTWRRWSRSLHPPTASILPDLTVTSRAA